VNEDVRGAINILMRAILESASKCIGNILCNRLETRVGGIGQGDQSLRGRNNQVKSVSNIKLKAARRFRYWIS
jgi:hypothetical protein